MIKTKDILFDSSGHKVIVNSVNDSKIFGVKITNITISYPDSKRVEYEEKKNDVTFLLSDIGIKLFFNCNDFENHKKLSIKEPRYTNKEEILNHFKSKHEGENERIQKDAPTGPVMDEKLKSQIIQSYYIIKEAEKQEIAFRDQSQHEYFGRIDLDTHFYRKHYEHYLNNHYYDRVYITKEQPTQCAIGAHIVNWRAPIASLYYDNEQTSLVSDCYVDVINPSLLDSPNNIYEHQLMLKRNFTSLHPLKYNNIYISGNEFFAEGTSDSFLIEVLIKNRANHKITDIIKTIQSSQNKIIRENHKKNLVVQGCAGSGKTMILLHRLSYLMFNALLPNLKAVRIITPNKNFSVFIKDLAISLDLEEIDRITIFSYYFSLVKKYQKSYSLNVIKDTAGVKINEKEVEINKLALMYFNHDKISDALNIDAQVVDRYYESSLIYEIKDHYDSLINSLYKEINMIHISSLCEKMNIILPQIKKSSKQNLDELLNICIFDLPAADKKIKDEIKNLEVKLQYENEIVKTIQTFSDLLIALTDILTPIKNATLSMRNEYLQVFGLFKRSEALAETIEHLKFLQREFTILTEEAEKQNNILNHEIDNKLNILNDLTSAMKNLRIFQFQKRLECSTKMNNVKAEIETLKKEKSSIDSNYQLRFNQITQSVYNYVNNYTQDFSLGAAPEHYVNMLSNINQQNLSTLYSLLGLPQDILLNEEDITGHYLKKLTLTYDLILDNNIAKLVNNIGNNFKLFMLDDQNQFKVLLNDIENNLRYIINLKETRQRTSITNIFDAIDFLIERIINLDKFMRIQKSTREAETKKIYESIVQKQSKLLSKNDINIIRAAAERFSSRGQIVIDYFKKIRDLYREKFNISSEFHVYGKHELIILLLLYYFHCGKIETNDQMLFIDEGQDYSINEYKLIRLINSDSCILNVFGDTNQCIYPNRGIKNWDDLCKHLNGAKYTLNENYRNSVEITDFTNKRFNLNTFAIGIHGPAVKYVSTNEVSDIIALEFNANSDQRFAYISNGNKPSYIASTVHFGSVSESKGLEFDIVFVDPQNMTKNEEYIAFTRALEKLYILNIC